MNFVLPVVKKTIAVTVYLAVVDKAVTKAEFSTVVIKTLTMPVYLKVATAFWGMFETC